MRDQNGTTNYFKLTKFGEHPKFVFFNDNHLASVESAYLQVLPWEEDEWRVSTFSPVHCSRGIWDRFPIVGHRSQKAIEEDLRTSCTDQTRVDELVAAIGSKAMYTEAYSEELKNLLVRYTVTAGGAL